MCTSFVLRALIPVGYMPAAWDDGLPFVLCPDGLPTSIADELSGHGHHHGDDAESSRSDAADQCKFGHIVSSAFLLHEEAPLNLTITGSHESVVTPSDFVGAPTASAYLPRGPPILKRS